MDWSAFTALLTESFRQFPVVVLCGLVLWRTAKYFDARHKEVVQALQSQHESYQTAVAEQTARHITDLKAQHAVQVELMQKEIDRLVANCAETTKDRDRLLRRIVPDEK